MAFSRGHFIRHRPYLYHFTNPENAGMLRQEKQMRSAAAWVQTANAFNAQVADVEAFLGAPRLHPVKLMIGPGRQVRLNDQRPLRTMESFAALRGTYDEFLRCLNDLVFFWPGDGDGPTPKGSLADSFARRYTAFGCLRVPTADLWGDLAPIRFCCCNSGAPQARDRIERGPHIFLTHDSPDLRAAKVAEVVFTERIALQPAAEWRASGGGEWQPLFGEPNSMVPAKA